MSSRNSRLARPSLAEVRALIEAIKSPRKVRPVVTPSGHRARGKFPSLKATEVRFESLVEEDTLRVLEVASTVDAFETHPYVLRLRDPMATGQAFEYTPDGFVSLKSTAALFEVKGDWLLQQPAPRATLRRICLGLLAEDVPFLVVTESDARPAGLQSELKELLKRRPGAGRRRNFSNLHAWDPFEKTSPTATEIRRWRAAQAECNALLDRVMRRDPDQFIETLTD